MIVINISLPLLGCQSDIVLSVQYDGPQTYGCSVAKYEKIDTVGESAIILSSTPILCIM